MNEHIEAGLDHFMLISLFGVVFLHKTISEFSYLSPILNRFSGSRCLCSALFEIYSKLTFPDLYERSPWYAVPSPDSTLGVIQTFILCKSPAILKY